MYTHTCTHAPAFHTKGARGHRGSWRKLQVWDQEKGIKPQLQVLPARHWDKSPHLSAPFPLCKAAYAHRPRRECSETEEWQRKVLSVEAPLGRKVYTFHLGHSPAQNLRAHCSGNHYNGLEIFICTSPSLGSKLLEVLCQTLLHPIRVSLSSSPGPSHELQTHAGTSRYLRPNYKSQNYLRLTGSSLNM